MEIAWSQHSLNKAKEIGDFIALDSSTRAKAFIDKLIKSISRLRLFPYSGSLVAENPAFRHLIFDGYRIIYRVGEKSVEIVTILSPGLKGFRV